MRRLHPRAAQAPFLHFFSLPSTGILTGNWKGEKEILISEGYSVLLSTSAESLPVCPWSKTECKARSHITYRHQFQHWRMIKAFFTPQEDKYVGITSHTTWVFLD